MRGRRKKCMFDYHELMKRIRKASWPLRARRAYLQIIAADSVQVAPLAATEMLLYTPTSS